jgi:hypothetical protein
MQRGNLRHDRKPQPGTVAPTRQGTPVEPIEDPRQILLGDPGPTIQYLNHDPAAGLGQYHLDTIAVAADLHRVADQVRHRTLQRHRAHRQLAEAAPHVAKAIG